MRRKQAVGSLVVRAPDSGPEGLGFDARTAKYPPSTHRHEQQQHQEETYMYEDDLGQTQFSSKDSVTAEIRERFQHLENLAQKYAFLRLEVILSMDELNLDQAPQDVNKEEYSNLSTHL
ncbi:hypothetical protein TNCV_3709481 [Trichonephila clavipes]|nr:hypothetical protein TNCV_3709481 [Trichonephila clavipes]